MNGGRFFMQVVIHDMNRKEFQKIYEKLKNESTDKGIGKRNEKSLTTKRVTTKDIPIK